MDFKSVPLKYQPAYTWLWNTAITKDGIVERIDEMYDSGIRAFYVLGEPKNFRPNSRRTHLSPEYLSDEYVDLVYFAYEYAKKKGMNTWLYNEGGFPSGMACGKICELRPDLRQKLLFKRSVCLKKGEGYKQEKNVIAAFSADTKISAGQAFSEDTELVEYYYSGNDRVDRTIQSDNASRENTELFIKLTHEKLKNRFGDKMGTDVKLMFDDEAFMGTWTDGFDKLFYEKYGYEIFPYLPFINGDKEPKTEKEYRAKSDYVMLCGDLVRDNYFIPMKEWLNKNAMLSTGHIDNDHIPDGNTTNRYGNSLKTLRAFDVPGVDAIWSQISYPEKGATLEGMRFFPRLASSAARQLGHSDALSESFAVYGSHVDPELMRFGVNCQAVRGISLFNFMVMSYDRKTPMMHQYRPNYIKDNPSMDRLFEINNYTARLSYILSSSRADIKTALYYPARSIAAGGEIGKACADDFTRLGHELEDMGVSFDLIDEELVTSGKVDGERLILDNVIYENVITPLCNFELPEVVSKLAKLGKNPSADIERENKYLLSRKVIFGNGDEGYFIVNTGGEKAEETVKINTDKYLYEVALEDGEIYSLRYEKSELGASVSVKLLRGEGILILASEKPMQATKRAVRVHIADITDFESYVSRKYKIDAELGTVNEYFKAGESRHGLYTWDKDFSGEVTYTASLPTLDDGEYLLELGEVRSTAAAYIDGELVSITTLPPHFVKFANKKQGRTLKIIVANTAANECARTDYFDKMNPLDVGRYHEKMRIQEAKAKPGGLLGPVKLYKLI